MDHLNDLKTHLLNLLYAEGAHISFDDAVENFPAALRGMKPKSAPHTPWQLLEHLRIAQWDILEFSRNPKHISPKWPKGYWPESDAPPDDAAWKQSIANFRRDLEQMKDLLNNASEEQLYEPIAHGEGQTLLREVLLVADHNSYHLGQLVYARKTLEAEGKRKKP
jgi:DinB family protein